MRESIASRFGFLMLAAGCAVGLGNVWRFPFIVGRNGGGAFVLLYLVFLALLGFPLLVGELAIGRGARLGIASALKSLAKGARARMWGVLGLVIFAGNFVLMIYYTDVAGWLADYAVKYAAATMPAGDFPSLFASLVGDRFTCAVSMAAVVAASTAVCALGVVNGVERVAKVLMVSLLALLGILAAKAATLPGAAEGLRFYLVPDWARFMQHPWRAVMEAMGQAFFTLSLGIGCMTIFGSYTSRGHSLGKEALYIIVIDTFVALLAGAIIFPACLSYGIEPSAGPGLIFTAMPEVFAQMDFGRFWGFLFFLFLAFAAFTTIIAVFECLIGGLIDAIGMTRKTASLVTGVGVAFASLPCVLFDGVLDVEDFAVSQLWLPLGALAQAAFISLPSGWGFEAFLAEANAGCGLKLPRVLKWHLAYIVPALIAIVIATGIAS